MDLICQLREPATSVIPYKSLADLCAEAANEIARLQEQLSHGMPAIEELTKEREMYRMRWLGSMTTRDARLIRDENARLRLENWQLKGALGYPVPGDIPQGAFKCGLCEARAIASHDEQSQESKS